MATTLDSTRLIQKNLVGKNQKPKPDRYNIYQLLQNDGRYGVVTRSGVMVESGDEMIPKLSLISGKFHEDKDKAQSAYEALVSKMKQKAEEGSYTFDMSAKEEWDALTLSVEKRQRALEERRSKKIAQAEKEAEKEVVEDKIVKVEAVEEEAVEEEAVEEEAVEEEAVEEVEIIKIEDPNLFNNVNDEEDVEKDVQEQEEEEKPKEEPKKSKRKGGRKAVVPAHFKEGEDDREEEWQKMSTKERRDWKRQNPVEEE